LGLLRDAARAGAPFQVVLIDQQMPGMDGSELAVLIRSDPDLAAVPLVRMTSLGRRRSEQEDGPVFDAVLQKPLRQPILRECLSRVLAERGEQRHKQPTGRLVHPPPPERGAFHLLLVEDNPVNQLVALEVLKKLGYRADTAANGLEALLALRRVPYDLLLMDCQMPEMDGFQATQALRDPGSGVINPQVPVIALTARAMQADRARCAAAGMNDYLPKPIQADDLVRMMEKWLPGEEQAARLPTPIDEPLLPAAAAEAGADASVLNEAELLQRLMNDRELVIDIVAAFMEDAPRLIAALKKYAAAGDMEGVHRYGHTLKGASANLSAGQIRQIAYEIEILGAGDSLAGMETLLARVDQAYAKFKAEVTRRGYFTES
ncbi:MAG: response regulator, partial [Anaerolineaceae bacterium]|nr:response regulator [Anaerolineaceae bacterium]